MITGISNGYDVFAGLPGDVFNCVANTLTFPDFMAVFCGQAEPLQRLRVPLQALIRDKVLRPGEEPTDANIERAVERLLVEMEPEINNVCVSLSDHYLED